MSFSRENKKNLINWYLLLGIVSLVPITAVLIYLGLGIIGVLEVDD